MGADRVAGQLRGDKECAFSGVIKSGRVWRKVPESGAQCVCVFVNGCVSEWVCIIIIIMFVMTVLMDALSAHMMHTNLSTIFYIIYISSAVPLIQFTQSTIWSREEKNHQVNAMNSYNLYLLKSDVYNTCMQRSWRKAFSPALLFCTSAFWLLCNIGRLFHGPPRGHTHTHSLSLSLMRTHTHHSLSLSLSHTHTHTQSKNQKAKRKTEVGYLPPSIKVMLCVTDELWHFRSRSHKSAKLGLSKNLFSKYDINPQGILKPLNHWKRVGK